MGNNIMKYGNMSSLMHHGGQTGKTLEPHNAPVVRGDIVHLAAHAVEALVLRQQQPFA